MAADNTFNRHKIRSRRQESNSWPWSDKINGTHNQVGLGFFEMKLKSLGGTVIKENGQADRWTTDGRTETSQ